MASDPKFGIGYLVLAVSSRNLGRMDESRKYLAEALSHLDGMTERERYQTRGYSYVVGGDYEQCVKEFNELLVRYPSDVAGRNQLALCLSSLRKMRPAMDAMPEIVKVLPKQPLFRDNLALYANYASDFTTAEQEARQVEGQDAYATLALAFAQLGQGDLAGAKKTYEELAAMNGLGASWAASGLGDLASVEGRFSEAVQILRAGATADVTAKNPEAAAAKLVAAAYAELSQGRGRAAIDLAADALQQNAAIKIRFLAGRTFIEAGDADRARPLIDALGKELFAEPRAYAKLLEGLAVLKQGDARQAAVRMRDANVMFDTWIGQFDLGRAALAAGATTQADSAFDACLNARRGEALALFVDEEPTFAYWPQGYYYQGLVREALHNAGAAESFRKYLSLRAQSTADPLVKQVRDRLTEPRAGTRSSQ